MVNGSAAWVFGIQAVRPVPPSSRTLMSHFILEIKMRCKISRLHSPSDNSVYTQSQLDLSLDLSLHLGLPGPTRLSPPAFSCWASVCCLEISYKDFTDTSLTHCSLFVLQGRW